LEAARITDRGVGKSATRAHARNPVWEIEDHHILAMGENQYIYHFPYALSSRGVGCDAARDRFRGIRHNVQNPK